jgi:hypothetical protein
VLKCDENLPNVNKTKHPKKGGKRYKMEAPKSKHKRKNHQQKWIARGGNEQVKYSTLLPLPTPSHKEHIK